MGKHTVQSVSVNCPICNTLCKSRGLHAHLRLAHPEVDHLKYLRKVIVKPLHKGERIIFQVLEMPTGQYKISNITLNSEELNIIHSLLECIIRDGHYRNHPNYDRSELK